MRKGKKLYTDNTRGEPIRIFEAEDDIEEARFISLTIKKLLKSGFKASDIAVFYRTNVQSRILEDSLRREGINYQIIGGLKFFERKEIKDIIAYLRFSIFEEDEISLFRILNTPRRGLGTTIEEKIKKALEENTKQLEFLQQQSKLASMGEMLGAIAHQWRQPLNALGLNIQLLIDMAEDNDCSVETMEQFVERNMKTLLFLSHTIDDFANFFKKDKEKQIFSIKKAIENVINIQSAQLAHHNIKTKIEGEDFEIDGYPNEFKQVFNFFLFFNYFTC